LLGSLRFSAKYTREKANVSASFWASNEHLRPKLNVSFYRRDIRFTCLDLLDGFCYVEGNGAAFRLGIIREDRVCDPFYQLRPLRRAWQWNDNVDISPTAFDFSMYSSRLRIRRLHRELLYLSLFCKNQDTNFFTDAVGQGNCSANQLVGFAGVNAKADTYVERFIEFAVAVFFTNSTASV
jgi:hypothetical protein